MQRTNVFVSDQVVVKGSKVGLDLLDPANALAQETEVVFAVPNFVTEYSRDAAPIRIPVAQWHLQNRARTAGQLSGEDVNARRRGR